MASARDAYYIRVRAYLKLAGTIYDLSQIELKFELRDVGRAVVQIPVGRKNSEKGFNTISNVSKFMTDVYPLSKAEIWMKLTPGGGVGTPNGAPKGKKLGFPADKDFKVFNGYVQSPGQLKDISGTAVMSLSLFGNLGGLAGSTMFSRNFNLVPDNANSSVPTVMGKTNTDVAASVLDYFSTSWLDISKDIWWNGLYLLVNSTFDEDSLLWLNQPTGRDVIRESLARINTGQFDAVKLNLRIDNPKVEGHINRSLSWMFANAVFLLWKYGKGGNGGDLLSVIRDLQEELQYTLSPGIDHDGVLPLCGMLGLHYTLIEPSEYSAESVRLHFNDDDFSYITSVGMLPSTADYTPWQDAPTKAKFVGFATLPLLIKGTPRDLPNWPTRIVMQMARPWMMPPPADSVSGNNAARKLPDAYDPEAVAEKQAEQLQKQQHMEEAYLLANLGSNYAGAYLANNLFRNRTMIFTGRLRFDICAGSTIGIRLVEDMFASKPASVLYGLVESVKIDVGIGNGSPRATTTFVLSSVRTQKEHDTLTVKQNKHPMFESPPFVGAPLTQEAAK